MERSAIRAQSPNVVPANVEAFRYNKRLWLWVPAFAGTTHTWNAFAHPQLQIQISNSHDTQSVIASQRVARMRAR
jgi:hypothetical protein